MFQEYHLLAYSININKLILKYLNRVSKMFFKLLDLTRNQKKRVTSNIKIKPTYSKFFHYLKGFQFNRVTE